MENIEEPVNKIIKIYDIFLKNGNQITKTLSLSPNEFVDRNDSIGLIAYDPDPLEFLTVEKEIEQTIYVDSALPSLEITFELSDIKRT